MRKTVRTSALAALAAASLAAAGCSGNTASGHPGASATLNLATLTLPQSLDPEVANGSAMPYFQAVYDTLIKRDPDGGYRPMLATAWTYDAGRTKLSLTLRSGVKFTDGTAFDAAAVKANMERFKKGGGGSATQLGSVASVTAVDPTHVTIALSHPDPSMLFNLSDAAGLMASPAAFAEDTLKTTPDGTGPYVLDKGRTITGTKWVFTRSPSYWGEKLPYGTVTMNYFDNETAIVNGIRTHQIDAAVIQDADQQKAVTAGSGVTAVKQQFDFQGLLLFDRGGALTPALRDPRVRQALNYAIDRDTMLQQIRQGQGTATDQVFGPDSQGYDRSLDSYYSHDPARARELLAQAGYAKGFTLKLPRITAIVPDPLAASLRSDLKAVGVTLVWDQVDAATVLTKIFKDRAYSGMVMNMGQSNDDWTVITSLVLPGTFNMFGTSDPTVATLTGKIPGESASAAAADEKALNRHLVQEGWFVPFYRMTYLHVSDGSVRITPQSGMAVPSLYDYAPAR